MKICRKPRLNLLIIERGYDFFELGVTYFRNFAFGQISIIQFSHSYENLFNILVKNRWFSEYQKKFSLWLFLGNFQFWQKRDQDPFRSQTQRTLTKKKKQTLPRTRKIYEFFWNLCPLSVLSLINLYAYLLVTVTFCSNFKITCDFPHLFKITKKNRIKFSWYQYSENPPSPSIWFIFENVDFRPDTEKNQYDLLKSALKLNRYRRKRSKLNASIFDSALSHTRRSNESEKRRK